MHNLDDISLKAVSFLQNKVDRMKDILASKGVGYGSTISQSITVTAPKISIDRMEVTIAVDKSEDNVEYWEFVDQGVSGTRNSQGSPFRFKNERVSFKMERALANHMKRKYGEGKGFRKRGEYYGLGVHIKREGIRPTRFYSDTITPNTLNEFSKEVGSKFKVEIQR